MNTSFERADDGGTQVWLTPLPLLRALGPFDLDPCACSEPRPWPTAALHYVESEDGLTKPWNGFVWCNPPYSPSTLAGAFIDRMAQHGNGLLLIFARTETENWHRSIWGIADAVYFFEGRLAFHKPDGTLGDANAGAPSALIAYGAEAVRRMERLTHPACTQFPGFMLPIPKANKPLQLQFT
jgi:hypothetical protein